MEIGKLDNETLQRLVLGRTGAARQEVIAGPGIGEDCSVLDFGAYECVLSTDPITSTASHIGTLAVHVACNDVASNGVEPFAVMLTFLFPPSVTEEEIGEIARQADEAAKELGVQIAGGHTEITDAVTQPIASATAIGRVQKKKKQTRGGASFTKEDTPKPGDMIVVTKSLALEGTAIAAEQHADKLSAFLTSDEIEYAKAMLDRISVVREGVIAGNIGIHAMHDITEGGILGAVWELCTHYGVGAEVQAASLPFDPVTLSLCAILGLDPMRLISSGSMLIFASEKQWGLLRAALSEADVAASVIGRIQAAERGLALVMKNGESEEIAPPGPDEIYRI